MAAKATHKKSPVPIFQADDAVLREHANPVAVHDITTPKIKKIIADMKAALDSQDDGAAIAAPQIGHALRIFVVSGRILKKNEEDPTPPDITFINPKLTKVSKKTRRMDEGCLSVRGYYGMV